MISEQCAGKDAQGSGFNTESSIENRIQTHGKFHGLIFPPITYVYITYHVRVSGGNYILHLSGMLDFHGTETLGNRSLKVLLHFSCDSSLTYVCSHHEDTPDQPILHTHAQNNRRLHRASHVSYIPRNKLDL
jgi:hypothetical protein